MSGTCMFVAYSQNVANPLPCPTQQGAPLAPTSSSCSRLQECFSWEEHAKESDGRERRLSEGGIANPAMFLPSAMAPALGREATPASASSYGTELATVVELVEAQLAWARLTGGEM